MKTIILIMGVLMMCATAEAAEKQQKFYITWPGHITSGDSLNGEDYIVVHGKHRVDALDKSGVLSGLTIWDEDGWTKMAYTLRGVDIIGKRSSAPQYYPPKPTNTEYRIVSASKDGVTVYQVQFKYNGKWYRTDTQELGRNTAPHTAVFHTKKEAVDYRDVLKYGSSAYRQDLLAEEADRKNLWRVVE